MDEDYDLYLAMRKVGDIVAEEVRKAQAAGAVMFVAFHSGGINPFCNQTDSGLFLEYYYGTPIGVWTPWGCWQFVWRFGCSGNPWPKILKRVLERLGATEFMPFMPRNVSHGVIGPVYAIHKVDDIELPEPKVREHQNYWASEMVKEAWAKMDTRYSTEHSEANAMFESEYKKAEAEPDFWSLWAAGRF